MDGASERRIAIAMPRTGFCGMSSGWYPLARKTNCPKARPIAAILPNRMNGTPKKQLER